MSNPYQVREWLKDLPPQQLKMYADGKNPADVPPWLAVAEMTRRQRMQQGMKTPPQGTVKDKIESQFDQPSQDEEMDDQAKLMSLLAQRQQKGQQDQGQIAQNAPTIPENVPQPEEQPQVQYAAKGGRLNGVAGLPANMFKFAHGGIVAFDGTDGSEVIDEGAYFGKNVKPAPRPVEIQDDYAKQQEDLRKLRPPGLRERKGDPYALVRYQAAVDAIKNRKPEERSDLAALDKLGVGKDENKDYKNQPVIKNIPPQQRITDSGIAARRNVVAPAPAPSAAPELVPPKTEEDLFVQIAQKYLKNPQETEKSFADRAAELKDQNRIMGIGRIGEGSEQRAQIERDEYNASKKDRALNDLQALLSAGARRNATGRMQSGTMGETGVIRDEANRAADAAFNKAQRDREEALAQLRRAELVGDRDKIVAAQEKVKAANAELLKNQATVAANIAATSVHANTANYGTAVQNAAADRKYKLDLLAHQATVARLAAETNSTAKQIEQMVLSGDPKYKPVIDRYVNYLRDKTGNFENKFNSIVEKKFETLMKSAPIMALKEDARDAAIEKLHNLAVKMAKQEVGDSSGIKTPLPTGEAAKFGAMTSSQTTK